MKMFNIVPMCGIKSHFITIDVVGVYGIMRDAGFIDEDCTFDEFEDMKDDYWECFMYIEKLEGQFNKFTGTIQTDGVSMCTHFTRPSNAQDLSFVKKGRKGRERTVNSDSLIFSKEDRVIGVDPGRSNIIYAIEPNEDGSFKKYELTRRQYYSESGIFAARKNVETWQKTIKTSLLEMTQVSTKGVDIDEHNKFINKYMQHYNTLWNEYTKPRWSRQRMRLHGGKKRTFAKFFNRMIQHDPRPPKIAYGNGCTQAGGKGEMSVPVSRAFRECCYRFQVKVIDEFRTTKIFHEDGSQLQNVMRMDKRERLRGLLWCNSPEKNKFVNRDFNGAMNIRRCAFHPRPLELTRIEGQPKIVMSIGKFIKC